MKKRFKNTLMGIGSLVMALSIGTVAYAGFTRQYTPELKEFGITVASQESMLISKNGLPSTFKDMVKYEELFESKNTNILPLLGQTSKTDNEYENLTLSSGSETVFDSKNLVNDSNINSRFIAFNLYFISSSDMNLYLGNDSKKDKGIINIDETSTSSLSFTQEQKDKLLNSMRIGFLTYATTYPPNSGVIKYSTSPVDINIYAKEISEDSYKENMFNKLGYNTSTKDGVSLALVKANKVTKIKVVIWLEGADIDPDLVSAIARLKFNISFQAVKVEERGNE